MSYLTALLVLLALRAAPAQADAAPLAVTLRDIDAAGLPGVTVIARAPDGRELARATTDAGGAARFTGALAAPLRIEIVGRTAAGAALYQAGGDAAGLLVVALPATIELRVEPDGMVVPDPATMFTRDPGPAESAPPAPMATRQPARLDAQPAAPDAREAAGGHWAGIALLALLLGLGAAVIAIQSRWRAGA